MYLLLPCQSHGLKYLPPLCMCRAHPSLSPSAGPGKAGLGVCGLALGRLLDSREGWLVQGPIVGYGRGLASSQTSTSSPWPVEASFQTALAQESGMRVSIGAARPLPLGCWNPACCFILPAPSCPCGLRLPAGSHGLDSVGLSWCQAEDYDSP